jgi:hypothetical protein
MSRFPVCVIHWRPLPQTKETNGGRCSSGTKLTIDTKSGMITKPSIFCTDDGATNFNYSSSESDADDNTWVTKQPRSSGTTKYIPELILGL